MYCGSGLNLSFYSPQVQCVYGVDPSVELGQLARKEAAAWSTKVEFLSQSAEELLPLAKCEYGHGRHNPDPLFHLERSQRLLEMKRVLKPSGRLIFLEHGRAPDAGVVLWRTASHRSGSGLRAVATSIARLISSPVMQDSTSPSSGPITSPARAP
jgi:SAM-dependent methyltransferase